MRSRLLMLLVGAISPMLVAGEFMVVPHIAGDTNSFHTRLVLENRTAQSHTMSLNAYNGDELINAFQFEIQAGERFSEEVSILIPGHAVTHLIGDNRAGLFAGVEYVPTQHPENRTYVEGISAFSQRWRVHPSNWAQTFDGLVIVNPMCYATRLTLSQYKADGTLIFSLPIEHELEGFQKLIYNLAQNFQNVEGSYIEVQANHPIAVMALKGSLGGSTDFSFLVGNQAEPYARFESLLDQVSAHRERWLASGLAAHYSFRTQASCYCPQSSGAEVTVSGNQLARMIYLETGLDVGLADSRSFHTILELYDLIIDAVHRGADDVRVEWNEELGYPISITIDWLSCAVDEEDYIAVTDLRPLDP